MNELYKFLNQEIEYFFDEQEFIEKDFIFIDVSDYQLIDEDQIDIRKLMFGGEIEGIELEEERLRITFDKFYLQDLREELMNDWNNQEIVKTSHWLYR